jgi:hypothetical protein
LRKAEDILQLFLDRIGRSDGMPYVKLFRSWQSIAGDRIAAHAEPVDIRGTALVVEVDHPGWSQMVLLSRERILRELGRRFPELTITGLHVRVAGERTVNSPGDSGSGLTANAESANGDSRRSDRAYDPPPPSADESESLGRIDDEDLRDSLKRLRESLDTSPDGKPDSKD